MKQISLKSFKEDVLDSAAPVILLFTSAWCTGCEPEETILNALSEKYDGIVFCKADADHETEINTLMHVSHLPAVFAMYRGRILDHTAGFMPAERMKQMCEALQKVI
jgi:thioredoxin 1